MIDSDSDDDSDEDSPTGGAEESASSCSSSDDGDSDGATATTRRHWPRVDTPCAAAADEFPFRLTTRAEADIAHGVANDNVPEIPAVAALHRLAFRNDPPSRRAAPAVPPQVARFVPRRVEDLVRSFTFHPHRHGSHVQLRLHELGLPSKPGWRLSPVQLWDEIEIWATRAAAQVVEGKRLAALSRLGEMRWLYGDWLIPETVTHPQAQRRIYDIVEALAARRRGELTYPVPLVDMSDPGAVWNRGFFGALFEESHCPDRLTAQVIDGRGVTMPFKAAWDTLLCRNAATLFEEITFVQTTLRAEVQEGLVSTPTPGLQRWPSKIQPTGVARIWRRGKAKNRGTLNATGKGRPERFMQAFSNNGWEVCSLRHNPDRQWNSADSFSFDVYICRPAFDVGDFCVRGADWSRFYRQVLDHPQHDWMFQCMALEEGVTRHLRKFFGDWASVIPCVLVQDALIWGLRWLVMRAWNITEVDDCRQWVPTLLQAEWMTARSRKWIEDRARVFAPPAAVSWRRLNIADSREQMHRFWNLVPVAIGAFFDDEFSGSGIRVQPYFTDGILALIRDGGVEGSLDKFYSVNAGGATFSLQHEDGVPPEVQTWTREESDGPADVLGRAVTISDADQRLDCIEDREAAVGETVALTRALIATARQAATRLAPVPAGERVNGQWGWLVGTRAWLRGLLHPLQRALQGRPARARARPLARRSQKFMMGQAAHAVNMLGNVDSHASAWRWREWGIRDYFTLTYAAESSLLSLMDAYEHARARSCMPRRSPVAIEDICFILNDNAGLKLRRRRRTAKVIVREDGTEPEPVPFMEEVRGQKRAGAAYFYMHGHPVVPFVQERWRLQALRSTHSTQGEMANGEANLAHAADAAGAPFNQAKIYWEVYDSESSHCIWRKMKAKSPGMQEILSARRRTIKKLQRRGARVLTFWCPREQLQISDNISKYLNKEARQMLKKRFPSLKIARRPWRRPRNVLNK